ncbi:MAG TPA: AAA family ATPase [Candidatus Dormibacteraeota bacterium]|nr:AAA family ATPase [Candidatus Dormibacteraeota bacterium]
MDKKLRIIGLAGTNGSGKDSVGQLLSHYHNYLFVSVTDLLRNELKTRDLPITRENLRMVSATWRAEKGLGMLMDMAMAAYETVKDQYNGIVISSLRHPGEADRVHELGGIVVWVDADPRIRYERIQANAKARGRSGEDNKTYGQFMIEEASEMNGLVGDDDTALSMSAVKQRSDIQIDNTQPDQVNLRITVEKALGL